MNLCACGNTAENNGTLCRRCAALQVLELGVGASEQEIKAAYRMLVKVWHPDRFQGDKALKDAADAKLKSINTAYVFLTSTAAMGDRPASKRDTSQDAAQRGSSTKESSTASRHSAHRRASHGSASRSTSRRAFPAVKILFQVVVVLLAILLVRYIWIAFDFQGITGDAATVFGSGKDSVMKGLETPKKRFLRAVEQDLRRLDPRITTPSAEEPAPATSKLNGQKANAKQQARVAPRKISPYITLGSTQEEVLGQLGTPTIATENKLVYGRSVLYFKDDSVTGWRIDPASSPIRVKLWPQSRVDTNVRYFTVGSSKDVVLALQGTPTGFSEDKFVYGRSQVYFQNNHVVRWINDPSSIPLRARY
jgi:hypothetical protein